MCYFPTDFKLHFVHRSHDGMVSLSPPIGALLAVILLEEISLSSRVAVQLRNLRLLLSGGFSQKRELAFPGREVCDALLGDNWQTTCDYRVCYSVMLWRLALTWSLDHRRQSLRRGSL